MKPLLLVLLGVLGLLLVGTLGYLRATDYLERRRLARETDELLRVNTVRDALYRHRGPIDYASVSTVVATLAAAGELEPATARAILAEPHRYVTDPVAQTFDARWIADQFASTRRETAAP